MSTVGKSVGTTPVLLFSPTSKSQSVVISNNGAFDVFVGESDVAAAGATMGIRLTPGHVCYIDQVDALSDDVYGVAAANPLVENVSVWSRNRP